ncbi:hypothetical protein BDP27DRAFT_279581 [Rhodocollybia butyracea]|uniref:Uncharacterized protein n=1 Tax=Rhodocollybia butyracea TaxID=206335 RepID=A0A9P5PET1_9AGAR|nr:hypothetical protein BDP27DRAFT_279581 [Rhodocollybia butyracea]
MGGDLDASEPGRHKRSNLWSQHHQSSFELTPTSSFYSYMYITDRLVYNVYCHTHKVERGVRQFHGFLWVARLETSISISILTPTSRIYESTVYQIIIAEQIPVSSQIIAVWLIQTKPSSFQQPPFSDSLVRTSRVQNYSGWYVQFRNVAPTRESIRLEDKVRNCFACTTTKVKNTCHIRGPCLEEDYGKYPRVPSRNSTGFQGGIIKTCTEALCY